MFYLHAKGAVVSCFDRLCLGGVVKKNQPFVSCIKSQDKDRVYAYKPTPHYLWVTSYCGLAYNTWL